MKKLKKLVSLILVLCMVVGLMPGAGTQVEASEAEAQAESSTGLKEITFADFGIKDGAYGNTSTLTLTYSAATGDSTPFLNSIFSGMMKFNAPGTTYLIMSGNGWNGFRFDYNGADGSLAFTGTSMGYVGINYKQIEGLETLSEEFKFSMSLEECDSDGDGTSTDIIMKLYFNDVQYIDAHFPEEGAVLTNATSLMTNKIVAFGLSSATIEVASCLPTTLTNLTFTDFGVWDKTYNSTTGYKGGSYGTDLQNTLLTGTVKATARAMLSYGGIASNPMWAAIRITINADSIQLVTGPISSSGGTYYLYETDAGGVDFAGEMELAVSLQLWDYDVTDTDAAADAKLGIWINGMLVGGKFYQLTDSFDTSASAHLENYFYVYPGSSEVTLKSSIPSQEGLRVITLDDFGLEEKEYTAEAGATLVQSYSAHPDSLLNTMLSMNVKATGGSIYLQYAVPYGKAIDYGIRFVITETSIGVLSPSGYFSGTKYLYASNTSVGSFHDKEFTLSLSLVLCDADGDGADDVNLGVYIDGSLYEGEYITMTDAKDTLGNCMGFYVNVSKSEAGSMFALDTAEENTSAFEILTPEDIGAEYGEYTNANSFASTLKGTKKSASGKIFTTNVRFNAYHSELFFGNYNLAESGESNYSWYALRIGNVQPSSIVPGQRSFAVQYPGMPDTGIGKFYRTIDAGVAGVKLCDDTFKLGVSSRNVDSDGDGLIDDLEIGLWFNDKLYNNQYIYLTDAADMLKTNMSIYCSSEKGGVVLGDVTQETATEVEYCVDDFVYFVDGDTVKVDGSTYTESQVLDMPGVYDVEYTDGASTFKRNVTIYKTSDVTADGAVNVVDLVAMKRYLADSAARPITKPGELALGLEADVALDEAVIYASMTANLLEDANKIQAKEISESVIGTQSASGAYYTSTGMSDEGTSVLGISDTGADYQVDASKFDGSGLDFVLDFDTDREIKVLQMTDPQIIDSTQLTSELALSDALMEQYDPANRNQVLYDEMDALVEETKPDLILVTGDIVFGCYDDSGAALTSFIEKMESYRIPWAPIYGNHENESEKGVVWQCEQFVNASYCLFNRRHEIGGNGNYAIGLAVNGELRRTVYMMDSNGCYGPNAADVAAGEVQTKFGFNGDQIAWYRTVAAKTEKLVGQKVPSILGMHVAPAEVGTAVVEKGYQPTTDTTNVTYAYDLGLTAAEGETDFGFKNSSCSAEGNSLCEYIYPYLQTAGTDSVFFGHHHTNSLSVNWEGIQWTWGLKTGAYESNPSVTGGTLISVATDNSLTITHKAITERSADE